MSRRSLVLGIDGGGAKSAACLSDALGNILTRREGAGVNGSPVGLDSTARVFSTLIAKCCDDVRCEPTELGSVVIGLSGFAREADRFHLRDSIQTVLAKAGHRPVPPAIETTERITLEGAFDRGTGVVIIANSGSVIIGKTPAGEIASVGGWGRILGDEGSGYYIGREALVAIAHESDRHGNSGTLRDVVAKKFHLDSREQIIAAVYQEKFDIASLAPVVLQTAANNDVVAQRIVDRAATLLAEQAGVVVMRMGIRRKVGLVMTGGLLERETVYANALHLKILRLLPQVEIRRALHEPAYGAVLMAIDRLKKM